MAIPRPEPGLVVRYDYLWASEADAGRGGGKERPACLVAASEPGPQPRFVVLLPITHSRPRGVTKAVEIPEAVRRHLGLDDEPCWVIVSEHNVDSWPNAGLSPVPGRRGVFTYGFIPPGLFAKISAAFLAAAKGRKSRGVRR